MTALFSGYLARGTGTGSAFVEDVSSGYSRVAATISAPIGSVSMLSAGVTFGAISGAVTVSQRGIYDASTGGNLIAFWDMPSPIVLGSGRTDTLSSSDIILELSPAMANAVSSQIILDFAAGSVIATLVSLTGVSAPVYAGCVLAVASGVWSAAAIGGSGGGGAGLPAIGSGNTVATGAGSYQVLYNGTLVEYLPWADVVSALGVATIQGAQGPAGPTGAQGPQGPAGPTGAQGPQGPQGIQGVAGTVGNVGTLGTVTTVTTPGGMSVLLGSSGNAIELISLPNLATALSASISGGGSALPSVTGGNTITTIPGGAVLPIVTSGTTVDYITPANVASSLGLGGSTGLPVPGGANTVATPGTLAIPLVGISGTVEYITPINLIDAIGTFPTAATTSTVNASDLFVLYQGGTVANVGTVGALYAGFIAYEAANQPQISLTTPSTVQASSVFVVSGAYYNYIATPTLQISIDGGAYTSFPAGSSVTSPTAGALISLYVGGLATGAHTIQVKDGNGVFSNAISFNAVALETITLAAPAGVQPSTPYIVYGVQANYGTAAPTLTYEIDGGSYAALPSGSSVTTNTCTIDLPAISAGTHSLTVYDAVNGITSNTATYIVATETLTVTAPTPSTAIYAANAIMASGSYISGAPTGFDWTVSNGATWTTASSPIISNGTWSFPVTWPAATSSGTLEVRDHNLPSITASTSYLGALTVQAAPTPATITSTSIAASGSLVSLVFSEAVTLQTPSAISITANGVADAVTWPDAVSTLTTHTGTLALPITSGETVAYSVSNTALSFPNLSSTVSGAVTNSSTLAQSISISAPSLYQNAAQTIGGGYAGPVPSAINAKFDSGSYSAISGATIGGGAWAGTITAPTSGTHTLTVQEANYTGITTTSAITVSSGFVLPFTGASGTPTGNEALTWSGSTPSGFSLDGSGNLVLPSSSYIYGLLLALGTQSDGTYTATVSSAGSLALLFRANSAGTTYYALLYNGSGTISLYSSVANGFLGGTYSASNPSTIGVSYVGTTISAIANGTTLGTWTDSGITTAGYVGIGTGGAAGGKISQVTHT